MGQIQKNMPELAYLLAEVEDKYGQRIATTTDFESLSFVIEHQIGELKVLPSMPESSFHGELLPSLQASLPLNSIRQHSHAE